MPIARLGTFSNSYVNLSEMEAGKSRLQAALECQPKSKYSSGRHLESNRQVNLYEFKLKSCSFLIFDHRSKLRGFTFTIWMVC